MMDYGMGWGFGGLTMILVWLVPLVLVLLGVRFLIQGDARGGSDPASTASSPNKALTTLEERYARGEINREEFLQKRDDILGKK